MPNFKMGGGKPMQFNPRQRGKGITRGDQNKRRAHDGACWSTAPKGETSNVRKDVVGFEKGNREDR